MKYLLDTNICIFVINQRPDSVRRKLQGLLPGQVGISSVTVSELQYGVAKSSAIERNQAALDKFLVPLEVVAYDAAAARHYGRIRYFLERQGTPIGSMDLMIAAHALALDVVVVTHNVREFLRVPNLQVEDWTCET